MTSRMNGNDRKSCRLCRAHDAIEGHQCGAIDAVKRVFQAGRPGLKPHASLLSMNGKTTLPEQVTFITMSQRDYRLRPISNDCGPIAFDVFYRAAIMGFAGG